MSSQNGPTIAASQVIVNKAAKKIVIERKAVGGRETVERIIEKSTAFLNSTAQNVKDIIPAPLDNELEEGEIDADVPKPSTASKPVEKMESRSQRPEFPATAVRPTDAVFSSHDTSSATNGEQTSVQKKMTALERLKSLSFANSKSAVNPFTLAVSKPPATTPADYKNDKKHSRPSPPRQPSGPTASKRHRPSGFPDHQPIRPGPYERIPRHAVRPNMERDIDLPGPSGPYNRQFGQPPPSLRHRDFSYPPVDSGPMAIKPGPSWMADHQPGLRHSDFDDSVPVERRFSPPPSAVSEAANKPEKPTNEVIEEEPMAPISTVCWEKVRQLTISPEELNSASLSDLRSVVERLLAEETELIQLHLRLQDQMKNVRRTLDRSKQIDQLKKQALTAALAAKKAAKQSESSDLIKTGTKSAYLMSESDPEKTDEDTEEPSTTGQIDFEEALNKAISEQAASKKAYLAQYVQAANSHHHHNSGAPFDYDPRFGQSSSSEQSTSVSKEKFVAMLASFFDGVASIHDRSLCQEQSPT